MLRYVPRKTAALAIVLVLAGVVLGLIGEPVAALVAGGLGGIFAAAAAFYAVGRSEDADRERGTV